MPENALNREVENIKACQNRMRQTLENVNSQLGVNRNARHILERDLQNKDHAIGIDHSCHQVSHSQIYYCNYWNKELLLHKVYSGYFILYTINFRWATPLETSTSMEELISLTRILVYQILGHLTQTATFKIHRVSLVKKIFFYIQLQYLKK